MLSYKPNPRRRSRLQPLTDSGLSAEMLLEFAQLVTQLMRMQRQDELIDTFTQGIQHILHVDVVLTWMHNPASHRYVLTSIVRYGKPLELDERVVSGVFQVRSGEALAGKVVSDGVGRILTSSHAYRAEFGSLGRRREGLFTKLRSYLPDEFRVVALPLLFSEHERPLGVVELITSAARLRSRDVVVLRQLFNQIGILLNFVRIQDEAHKQSQRLAALDAVVTAIGTASDLPELLQMALLVMIEVIHASGGAICLASPGQPKIDLSAAHNVPDGEMKLINSSEVTLLLEDVLTYGQPLLRPVLEELTLDGDILGRAAVPLLAGGTIVGVLLMYGRLEELTASLDWPALVSVSSQIAIAIANTRLYEESQRERQRLGTVIDSIADGVVICDGSGQIILANEAAATLLGLASLTELSQAYYNRNLHGESIADDQLPLARALSGEVFQDYQVVIRNAQGKDKVFSFSGAPLRGSTLTSTKLPQTHFDGAVVVLRDITEQRRLDEAKDEFLAIAAHELRSPLAAIKGYSDLLLRREQRQGTDERDLRGHKILNQQVNVLVQLVDNLLDISRIDAGRFTIDVGRVQINEVIDGVVTQINATAKKHTITWHESPIPALVWGDQLKIRQVLTNLLTNAIRYSPIGTNVAVTTEVFETVVEVAVDDEGPGIPEDQRERLFDRYYRVPGIKRTGSSTEGLGLGLYLCREIITLHEGRIWVEQAPSGGARFLIALPRYNPPVEENEARLEAAIDQVLNTMPRS